MPARNPLYFIALMPPPKTRKEIENFKMEIKARHGIKHALKLPAHITLQIPFRISEVQLRILLEKLDQFCKECSGFEIKLNGFGRFSKQVIFVKIEDHEPIIKLYKDLQDMILGLVNLKNHELPSRMHPHITIATRDLKRTHFPEIWNDFKDRSYEAFFNAQDIVLFKHNGKIWDHLKSFSLIK